MTERLFTPGDGALPPVLTGREREQEVLSRCLADLTSGQSPPHNVVLVGPRGNGKTVLLNWFEGACREVRVDVARLAPSRVSNGQALCNALLPATGLRRLLPAKWRVTGLGGAEWVTSPPAVQELAERLIRRCRRKPVAVLLDEAHTLDLDVGRILLNVSQDVRREAPFLLALAGTPGLLAHLGRMNASFWDRLGSGLLGIGRLSEAAARDALREPLAAHGVRIDDEALDAVVEHSQRYAYFVQLWGEALWSRRRAAGGTRLSAADAARARPDVATRVAEYHHHRYRELEAAGLLPAALAVTGAFPAGTDASATDRDIDRAFAAAGLDESGRLAAREALNRLGYIWCPPGQAPPAVWQAGIPSLMRHLLDHAAA